MRPPPGGAGRGLRRPVGAGAVGAGRRRLPADAGRHGARRGDRRAPPQGRPRPRGRHARDGRPPGAVARLDLRPVGPARAVPRRPRPHLGGARRPRPHDRRHRGRHGRGRPRPRRRPARRPGGHDPRPVRRLPRRPAGPAAGVRRPGGDRPALHPRGGGALRPARAGGPGRPRQRAPGASPTATATSPGWASTCRRRWPASSSPTRPCCPTSTATTAPRPSAAPATSTCCARPPAPARRWPPTGRAATPNVYTHGRQATEADVEPVTPDQVAALVATATASPGPRPSGASSPGGQAGGDALAGWGARRRGRRGRSAAGGEVGRRGRSPGGAASGGGGDAGGHVALAVGDAWPDAAGWPGGVAPRRVPLAGCLVPDSPEASPCAAPPGDGDAVVADLRHDPGPLLLRLLLATRAPRVAVLVPNDHPDLADAAGQEALAGLLAGTWALRFRRSTPGPRLAIVEAVRVPVPPDDPAAAARRHVLDRPHAKLANACREALVRAGGVGPHQERGPLAGRLPPDGHGRRHVGGAAGGPPGHPGPRAARPRHRRRPRRLPPLTGGAGPRRRRRGGELAALTVTTTADAARTARRPRSPACRCRRRTGGAHGRYDTSAARSRWAAGRRDGGVRRTAGDGLSRGRRAPCGRACSLTGWGVPSDWAKKLTRSSSIIQRTATTSASSRRSGGSRRRAAAYSASSARDGRHLRPVAVGPGAELVEPLPASPPGSGAGRAAGPGPAGPRTRGRPAGRAGPSCPRPPGGATAAVVASRRSSIVTAAGHQLGRLPRGRHGQAGEPRARRPRRGPRTRRRPRPGRPTRRPDAVGGGGQHVVGQLVEAGEAGGHRGQGRHGAQAPLDVAPGGRARPAGRAGGCRPPWPGPGRRAWRAPARRRSRPRRPAPGSRRPSGLPTRTTTVRGSSPPGQAVSPVRSTDGAAAATAPCTRCPSARCRPVSDRAAPIGAPSAPSTTNRVRR